MEFATSDLPEARYEHISASYNIHIHTYDRRAFHEAVTQYSILIRRVGWLSAVMGSWDNLLQTCPKRD